MARDAVLAYAPLAAKSGGRWGIPPATLLGLITVESGGNPASVSSTGAKGLTQFMPATAAQYHVGTDAASQVDGAAHYLHDLGYAKDAHLALSSYNAGPGNPGAAGPYAANVLAAAGRYRGLGPSSGAQDAVSAPQAPTGAPQATGGAGGPLSASKRSDLLKWALYALLIIGGGALVLLGITRVSGLRKGQAAA